VGACVRRLHALTHESGRGDLSRAERDSPIDAHEADGAKIDYAPAMTDSRCVRPERFGAMLRVEQPPALVSIDRVLARRLGVDGGALWEVESDGVAVDPLSAPTEVHLAVTERCAQGCPGCYADATPDGAEPSFDALCAHLDRLAEMRVFSVTFGGGEASLREDLFELAAYARSLGLVPSVTTSGAGVSERLAARYGVFAQVNVSWDGPTRAIASLPVASVRTERCAGVAEQAMELLRGAGVRFGVNFVLTRSSFAALAGVAQAAEERGAVELQLLRLAPGGRAAGLWEAGRMTSAQVAALHPTLKQLAQEREIFIRINCALLPLLWGADVSASDLARFGVMGCEAGRALMTVDVDGRVKPCSYTGSSGAALDAEPWSTDAALARHRAFVSALPEPCVSCDWRHACRGGCRVVAQHARADFAALDPECPRVRAFETDALQTPDGDDRPSAKPARADLGDQRCVPGRDKS